MVRSCRVTIKDTQDIAHTVEVTAESLYGAVALGLKALRGKQWVEGIREEHGFVQVSVVEIPVKHTVPLRDFNAWLESGGRSPREFMQRTKIRKILGLSTDR
jgi:hypothetical protein